MEMMKKILLVILMVGAFVMIRVGKPTPIHAKIHVMTNQVTNGSLA